MGAGQSGGVEIGGSSMGYQVLRVYPNSPGSRAGLRAYFDFIVAIGQTRFNKEDGSLREILKASVDQKIKMFVYNTRTKQVREVDIVPTTSWGGSGLLGVSIKHSSFDKADERVWHVIEVDPGSPAQQAGFKAGNDYVIGSDSILQENDDLYNLIEAHEGKALKLFVYNVETDNCREVICHPNSKWGGRGYLGCEFGHGLLHRMPYNETSAGGDSKKSSFPSNILPQPISVTQSQKEGIPPSQPNDLLQHQADILNRTATQPGQQLFQQALFSNQGPAQQQEEGQDFSKPVEKPTLPPPPQAPQTFAQLASAQFHTQQYQQQTAQIQQQQQLLEQQRLQLEEQKRQMDQLAAANQPPSTTSSKPFETTNLSTNSSNSYSSDKPPPPSHNYQPGPPLSPAPKQPQQQQPYTLPSQQSPPPPQMSPPPLAPRPTQPIGQPSPPPAQPQSQYQNQQYMAQSSPYQQYPYGGIQNQFPDQHDMGASPYTSSTDSSQSSLPPSVQTLPPPPMMYPPPSQGPPNQQQQQQQQHQGQHQLPLSSQPPPPPFPPQRQQQQQQPPTMFANQM